jgi:TRAP-type mannitol/chloroaromatic compound transport system permease small subunit
VNLSSSVAARIDALTDAVGRTAAWGALAIALLMAGNVLLRYAFDTGSVWAQELEWHLLAPLVLAGMSYAQRHGEHVRVDVFYARYGARAQAAVDLLAAALAIAFALFIVKVSIPYVDAAWSIDEGSSDPGGLPHRWLLKGLIPVGFALYALQSLAGLLQAGVRFREAGHAR